MNKIKIETNNKQTKVLGACCAAAWNRQVIKKRKETNQFFKKW